MFEMIYQYLNRNDARILIAFARNIRVWAPEVWVAEKCPRWNPCWVTNIFKPDIPVADNTASNQAEAM